MRIYRVPKDGDRISPKFSVNLDLLLAVLPLFTIALLWSVRFRSSLSMGLALAVIYAVLTSTTGRLRTDFWDRQQRRQELLWRRSGLSFGFENGVLTRYIADQPQADVGIGEITRIQEVGGFLRVSAAGFAILIPPDTEQCEELRGELLRARPDVVSQIKAASLWITAVSVVAAIVVVATFLMLPLFHERPTRIAAVSVLVTAWLWLWLWAPMIHVFRTRRPSLQRARKASHHAA